MSTQNINPNNRDFEASINTRPVTKDEIAYRNGYVRGRATGQLEQDRRRAAQAKLYSEKLNSQTGNSLSAGVVLGFTLAAVAAIFGVIFYFYGGVAGRPGAVTPTPVVPTSEPAPGEPTL
ncbi:MAG: hypothetical protein EA368_18765 [Leptolyngbya sp. DLM2.Bin27]|nr:MAG: hypothetical protein EA368_18765 [Leptolyngbya sp. DLM2.Bin27]